MLRRRNASRHADFSFMPFIQMDLAGLRRKCGFLSLGAAALLLAASRAPAETGAPTREGIARAASLMREIAETCPAFGANAAEADKFYRAFSAAGAEAFGEPFKTLLARETARRHSETQARGPALWCEEQREKQKGIGNGRLFETQP
jgi:hypothetical protein